MFNYLPTLLVTSWRISVWSQYVSILPNVKKSKNSSNPFPHLLHFQLLLFSYVPLFAIPWTAARQAPLSSTISWSWPKFMSIELVMLSNHLILCHPPLLLPSISPSIRVFSSESALRIRWPKYWSFSFSNRSSNEQSRLISFRIDWFDLLAVQRTLKSVLQHHKSKASVLRGSAFFTASSFP